MSYAFWNARKRKVGQLAEDISGFYFKTFPIDPAVIANDEGITYSYGNYLDYFDGLLQHQWGEFHIFLNLDRISSPDHPRARFTFGHELGHYFIDEHRIALKSGETPCHPSFAKLMSKNPVEREADYFSSCLLMPAGLFRTQCNRRALSAQLFDHLADCFQTSLSSVIFRYMDLNLFPMIIIFSRDGFVEWAMPTSDFRYKSLPPKKSAVPTTSVAGEFFYEGTEYQTAEIVYAGDWFHDRYMDINQQLYEKCYYLPNSSILSVLWLREK
ncbi:ImmA/IrrE family metallo-endopeptidase [Fibrella arboris]|uniref:ImmA/IrrE family metallo-endopeptidase n=1 Tax=Fibrella arboris TaxID=3242486 RepID=UPI00351FB2FC